MTKQTLFLALLAGLTGLLGCNSKKGSKTSEQDTTSVQKIDSNKLFFPSPTMNPLPEFVTKTDSCVTITENFWREFEFVSKDQKSSIEKEIAKIKDIQDNYKHGDSTWGYRKIAVRDLIPQPLSIDFSKFKSYFPDQNIDMEGLAIKNYPGQVKNGFYFTVGGVGYYGLLENNTVKTFCIHYAEGDADFAEAAEYLIKLLANEKLYLVDWSIMQFFDEKTIHILVEN